MLNKVFKLNSEYKPAGDQPEAILRLLDGLKKGMSKQTLLGATGTGKTFTMANVIEKWGKPTLVIAHNKTLAAQLAQEFREFFPDAAVHYFVSYYDYYQPEAYMPITDTYIEKDAQINKEIDRLRHASTQALLTRKDVIIVASVSCIYGLGSPEEYEKVNLKLNKGMKIDRTSVMKKLIEVHFERTNADINSGQFRSIGPKVEVMPVSETFVYQIEFADGAISRIAKVDPVSSHVISEEENIFLFPTKHFITDKNQVNIAVKNIKGELVTQLKKFQKEGKLLESERLKRRTNYDLAMIKEIGYCNGIENYSRHLSGKAEGEAPETLLSYFPRNKNGEVDFLTIIDESHVTLPQLNGMYAGDASRKNTLVEFGFRLPSAKDNRPLRYNEFEERIGQVIYTSATPSTLERESSAQIVEQIIRPTGLIDPEVIVRPVSAQISTHTIEEFQPNEEYSIQLDFIKNISKIAIKKNKKPLILSGGWALDIHIGPYRNHKDIDLCMYQEDINFWKNYLSKDFNFKEEKGKDPNTRFLLVGKDFNIDVIGIGYDKKGLYDLENYKKDYWNYNEENILQKNGIFYLSSDVVLSLKFQNSEKDVLDRKMVQLFKESRNPNEKITNYPGQIQDFIAEAEKTIAKGFRVLATTLTKRMAEDLSIYLKDKGIKAEYLHSEIKTIERIQVLTSFRKGEIDILVGVNLLREGLDLPEVALIGILDADKEGFLRSETSLIQTIGRAARNAEGKVILYADILTGSLESAIKETNRRRNIQIAYNKKNKITPKTIIKKIKDITEELEDKHKKAVTAELDFDFQIFKKSFIKEKNRKNKTEREAIKDSLLSDDEVNNLIYEKIIKMKEHEMNKAVKELNFETAAILRDEILVLKEKVKNKEK